MLRKDLISKGSWRAMTPGSQEAIAYSECILGGLRIIDPYNRLYKVSLSYIWDAFRN